jgi:hypothetical protein
MPWSAIWATSRKKVKTVDGRWHVGHIDLGLPVARESTGRHLIVRSILCGGCHPEAKPKDPCHFG